MRSWPTKLYLEKLIGVFRPRQTDKLIQHMNWYSKLPYTVIYIHKLTKDHDDDITFELSPTPHLKVIITDMLWPHDAFLLVVCEYRKERSYSSNLWAFHYSFTHNWKTYLKRMKLKLQAKLVLLNTYQGKGNHCIQRQ